MNTIIIDVTTGKEKLIDFIEGRAKFDGLKDNLVALNINHKTRKDVENDLIALIAQAKESYKIAIAGKELEEIQHEDVLAMISEIYNRGMSASGKNLVNPEIKKKLDDLDQNEIIKERLTRKENITKKVAEVSR